MPGNSAGSSFDLVILDYRMPKKDGIQVAKEVLARFPSQRIIIATAHTKEIFSWVPKELHHLEFLQKPFELDELIAVIEGRAKRKLS